MVFSFKPRSGATTLESWEQFYELLENGDIRELYLPEIASLKGKNFNSGEILQMLIARTEYGLIIPPKIIHCLRNEKSLAKLKQLCPQEMPEGEWTHTQPDI